MTLPMFSWDFGQTLPGDGDTTGSAQAEAESQKLMILERSHPAATITASKPKSKTIGSGSTHGPMVPHGSVCVQGDLQGGAHADNFQMSQKANRHAARFRLLTRMMELNKLFIPNLAKRGDASWAEMP